MLKNTLLGGVAHITLFAVFLSGLILMEAGNKSVLTSKSQNYTLGLQVTPNPVYLCGPGDSRLLTASFTSPCTCPVEWFNSSLTLLASGSQFTVSNAGTYYAIATGEDGITTQTVQVDVVSDFMSVYAGEDQTICQGDLLVLNGSGADHYQWIPAGVCLDPPTCSSVQVNPNPPFTWYYLIGENTSGCTAIDSVRINVNRSYNITRQESICEGESIFLGGAFQTTSNTYLDFYSTTAGCDSIIFTSLDVVPLQTDTVQRSICAGSSIFIGGAFQSNPGTYTDVFTDSNGCDSTVLSILSIIETKYTNLNATLCEGDSIFIGQQWHFLDGIYNDTLTAASGCDSILIREVDFLPNSITILDESICDGSCYALGGTDYCSSGTYQHIFPKYNGCDSTVILNLEVLPNSQFTQDIVICEGETYYAGGGLQTVTGTYADNLISANGCDSLLTTNLTVLDTSLSIIPAEICAGDNYSFQGSNYSVSGQYPFVYSSSNGCDSTILLDLIVRDTNLIIRDIQICTGESVYAEGANQSTSGTYVDIFSNSFGCDSTIVTNLSVSSVFENNQDLIICEGESAFLEGMDQYSSGVYRDTMIAGGACDTVLITNLLVIPNDTLVEAINICQGESYPAQGAQQTTTGTYYTLVPGGGTSGCNQIIETQLLVIPIDTIQESLTICAGEQAIINGQPESTSGVYPETRAGQGSGACDLIAEINLTVLSYDITTQDISICFGDSLFLENNWQTTSGTYVDSLSNSASCDSIVITNLNVFPLNATTTNESLCYGESILFEGSIYSTSGVYEEVYTDQNGCDSIQILNLSVDQELASTLILESACPGGSVNYQGTDYFSSVLLSDTLVAQNGCDSIFYVDIIVPPIDTQFVFTTECLSDTTGVWEDYPYTTIDQDINGCDSVTVVEFSYALNVIYFIYIDTTVVPGDSLLINGSWYYYTGVYTDTIYTADCPIIEIITIGESTHVDIMETLDVCMGNSVALGGIPADTTGTYVFDVPQVSTCCDTTFIFDVTVRDTFYQELDIFICEGDSVFLDGDYQTTNGVYVENLSSYYGCDSTVISTLTVIDTSLSTQDVSICFWESYYAGGALQTTSGTYIDVYPNSQGCDSTVLTNLTVHTGAFTNVPIQICASDSVEIGGVFYDQAQTVTETLNTQFGCDSTVAYQISVQPNPQLNYQFDACDGDSFTLHGQTFSAEGTYITYLPAFAGCDTLLSVEINFVPVYDTLSVEICEGQSFYAGGGFQTQTNFYQDTISVVGGCDTIRTTDLLVHPVYLDTNSVQICTDEFYFTQGAWQNTSGTYIDQYFSQFGCDSTVVTVLTVDTLKFTNLFTEICEGDSILLGGIYQTSPGVYFDTIPVSQVCDSILVTSLTVNPIDTTHLQASICEGDSIYLGGAWRIVPGQYEDLDYSWDTGCDSVLLTSLIVHPNLTTNLNQTICEWDSIYLGGDWQSLPGIYLDTLQTIQGCDSILITDLDLEPVTYFTDSVFICQGESILLGGAMQQIPGIYQDTIKPSGQCYNVISTELFINPVYLDTVQYATCAGDSILIEGVYRNTPGFYSHHYLSEAGCDSTIVAELTVNPVVQEFVSASICMGETYYAGGANQYFSGFYVDTLFTISGCDSIVTTNLLVHPTNYRVETDTICFGDCIVIGGSNICSPGTYSNVYQNQFGCDSTVITLVTLLQNSSSIRDTMICQGSSIFLGGAQRSSPGIYTDVYANYLGCDSTVITTLGIIPTVYDTISTSICFGDSIFLSNAYQTGPGLYNDTLSSVLTGCDSILTTNLSVRDTFFTDLIDYYCANDPILQTLPIGVQYDTLTAINGCDSVVATGVAVLPISQFVQEITICDNDSLFVGGGWQNTNGAYLDTLINQFGCDSLVLTKLEVLLTPETILDIQICQGESFFTGGSLQSASGIYTDTLTAYNTCDSIVIINLVVADTFFIQQDLMICEGESVLLGGSYQTDPGWYYDTLTTIYGCDSTIATLLDVTPTSYTNLEVEICQGETFLAGGEYQSASGIYSDTLSSIITGCDSVLITDLIVRDTFLVNLTEYVCENAPLAQGGIFTEYLQTQFGCDSTVVTEVILLPVLDTLVSAFICENDSVWLENAWQFIAGIYTDTLTSSLGCDSIRITDLEVRPTFQTYSSITLCEGDSIFLEGQWQYQSGNYTELFSGQNTCDSTHTTEVYFAPNYFVPLSIEICEGDSILLGGQYQTQTGVYFDTLQSVLQCDSVLQTSLQVVQTLESFLSDTICAGEAVFLAGEWQTESGTYVDYYQSSSTNCDSLVYTELSVIEIEVPDRYEICSGNSVQIQAFGGLQYEWFPAQGLSCTDCPDPIASPDQTTVYTVRDPICEESEWQVTVVVNPLPTVEAFASSASVLRYENIVLSASGSSLDLTYDWFDNQGNMICMDCQETEFTMDGDSTFVVMVTDMNGCTNQDSVFVQSRDECKEVSVFAPNIITPNGDGSNDGFYVETEGLGDFYHLRIFNRWGEMIFESNASDQAWDGTHNGKTLNPDTFVYYFEGTCLNGESYIHKGSVTLIK